MFAAGCGEPGPKRHPLSGTVSWEGQPVDDGIILFNPSPGTTGPVAAGPIRKGKYALTTANGPVAGRHRVEIRGMRMPDRQPQVFASPSEAFDPREQYIPAKYNTASTLEVEIDSTTKTLDYKLAK